MWENYAFLGVFAIGECLAGYFYGAKRRTAAGLFGSSSLVLGSVAFAGLYYSFSQSILETVWLSWLVIMVVVLYAAYKTAGVFFFLFLPAFSVAFLVSPSASILAFLSLLALLLGLLLSVSLSEFNLALLKSGTTIPRVLLAPFRQIEILVVNKLGKHTRLAIFLLDSLFVVAAVTIPILVGDLLQGMTQPEVLIIIPIFYFSVAAIMFREAQSGVSSATPSS